MLMYVAGETPINFETEIKCIAMLENKINEIKKKLVGSETNKLWLIYMEMVDILNLNLMAERSGNWKLYLSSLRDMLPLFDGSGWNN